MAMATNQTVQPAQAAQCVLALPAGSITALAGIDAAALCELIDQTDHIERRALFARLRPARSPAAYVEQLIAVMAETARRLWPTWYTNVSFAMCGNDTLGRQAASSIARATAARSTDVNPSWAEAAARLAVGGELPRVQGFLPEIEVAQLSQAIGGRGTILLVDVSSSADIFRATPLLHALEWTARHSGAALVVLFITLPPLDSPFDPILHGALRVIADAHQQVTRVAETQFPERWLAPWRGAPHPMSETERRVAAMLNDDPELAGMFQFNRVVDTLRGSHPRVDLLCAEARLVVELDGYSDHATQHAFIADRNRDYELTLSGYTVLRLANDEVAQDIERAIEKIRDLVRLNTVRINRS